MRPYTELAFKTFIERGKKGGRKARKRGKEGGREKGKEGKKKVGFVQMHWNGIHDIQIPSSLLFN